MAKQWRREGGRWAVSQNLKLISDIVFLFSSVGHLSLNNFVSWYTFDIDHSKHPIFIYFYLKDYCTGLEFQCEVGSGVRENLFFFFAGRLTIPPRRTHLACCLFPTLCLPSLGVLI